MWFFSCLSAHPAYRSDSEAEHSYTQTHTLGEKNLLTVHIKPGDEQQQKLAPNGRDNNWPFQTWVRQTVNIHKRIQYMKDRTRVKETMLSN